PGSSPPRSAPPRRRRPARSAPRAERCRDGRRGRWAARLPSAEYGSEGFLRSIRSRDPLRPPPPRGRARAAPPPRGRRRRAPRRVGSESQQAPERSRGGPPFLPPLPGVGAVADHLDRLGIAEDDALGVNERPDRPPIFLEGLADLVRVGGVLVLPGLVQPELRRVDARAVNGEDDVAGLAGLDPPGVAEQQLQH